MPLSEYEQRVLDQLEAQLTSEDPKLGSRMAAASVPPGRGRVVLGLAGVLIGLSFLILGVAVSQLWVSLIGFLVMFLGAYFAFTKPKPRPAAPAKPTVNPKEPRKPGLSDRFLKRFEDHDEF
jgi:hypothetical protein